MADIKIEGAGKLVRQISKRVDKGKVNNVVKRNTTQVQQKAQKYAPVADYMGGSLKRSITMEVDPAYMEGRVTAGMEYAGYVEYGTRFMDAQPYMRPARNEQAPIFLSDMKNLIKRG